MAEAQWYYGRDGAQLGPVAEAELRRMALARELPPSALVWRAGMPQWQPAWQATDFFPAAPATPPPLPSADLGANPAMRMLLPVGRSGWAIAAGYLGLLSVLLLPAPVALVISLVALSDLRKHRSKHGMGRAAFGLVMGVLGTVVLAIALISAAA